MTTKTATENVLDRATHGSTYTDPKATSVRMSLPGQREALAEQAKKHDFERRRSLAEVKFGLAHTETAIRQLILATAVKIEGRTPQLIWTVVNTYTRTVIPDEVIGRYVEALESGLFERFLVADLEHVKPPIDPWLIGVLPNIGDEKRLIVLAYWE